MSFIWEMFFEGHFGAGLLVFAQEHARAEKDLIDPQNAIRRQGCPMLTWLIASPHLKVTLNVHLGGRSH